MVVGCSSPYLTTRAMELQGKADMRLNDQHGLTGVTVTRLQHSPKLKVSTAVVILLPTCKHHMRRQVATLFTTIVHNKHAEGTKCGTCTTQTCAAQPWAACKTQLEQQCLQEATCIQPTP